MWVVANLDDDYIAKMEDVLELYERPYDPQRPVVCLDEKPITLHADLRPPSAAMAGREARRDNEYKRNGTANVFCAVEPKAGRHFTFATPDRSGFEFAKVAFKIALQYMEAKTIHLVLDNLNIHRRKSLTDWFGREIGSEIWDRFYGSLYAQSRELVEPGGDRNRPVRAAMPGASANPGPENFTTRIACLEPPSQPCSNQNQRAVRSQNGSPEVRLPNTIL